MYFSLTPEYPWSLWIWTSDVKGAGTDAQVFLQIYGENGKSDEIKLENNSDSFEQGQVDKFMVSPSKSVCQMTMCKHTICKTEPIRALTIVNQSSCCFAFLEWL